MSHCLFSFLSHCKAAIIVCLPLRKNTRFLFFSRMEYLWNSSYDSSTGRLVKTTDATDPSLYETTLFLSDEQAETIFSLLQELDLWSYPDEYNPTRGISTPSRNLTLTVR
ncbi:MAG TPA: hypothetical protein GX701_09540 [Clostridiales bacterium]|nr:hypothetical protein [Clostridiales bacterium]